MCPRSKRWSARAAGQDFGAPEAGPARGTLEARRRQRTALGPRQDPRIEEPGGFLEADVGAALLVGGEAAAAAGQAVRVLGVAEPIAVALEPRGGVLLRVASDRGPRETGLAGVVSPG